MSRTSSEERQLRLVKPTPLDLALDMFLLHQEASHNTPKTIGQYRYALGTFLRFLREQGVSSATDRRVREGRAEPPRLCHRAGALGHGAAGLGVRGPGRGRCGRDGMVKVMGKGRKERYTRLGARARKAVLRYLMTRGEAGQEEPL